MEIRDEKLFEQVLSDYREKIVQLQAQLAAQIVITRDERGQIVAVTRQDEEGRIVEVLAESESEQAEPVAWMMDDGTLINRTTHPERHTPLYTHPPKQGQAEPVAWAAVTENGKLFKAASTRESAQRKAEQQQEKFGDEWRPLRVVPLYTAPPRREWQGLTDGEAVKLWGMRSDGPDNHEIQSYASAVEQLLRGRNA